jgi:transposase
MTTEPFPGPDFREWRRRQALRLKQLGWKQRHIATALGASEAAVSAWLAAAAQGGPDALRSRASPGHPARLDDAQMRLMPDFLWHGAEAYGFRGEVWTCSRVAQVIEEEFGVGYHTGHVSRLLKALGCTPQVPITRALQRDEEAIARWQRDGWPALRRKADRERRTLAFADEAGFYLLAGLVKTYAPKGLTPVVYEWQPRDHLSVMGAVTTEGKVYSLMRQGSWNGLHTVEFLKHLLGCAGARLPVIWDGSPIHRRAAVKEFLASTAGRGVWVEALPAYTPDLNAVEWAWQQLKHVELRNVTCLDLEELHQQLHRAIGRLRQKPDIVRSFFAGAGLLL